MKFSKLNLGTKVIIIIQSIGMLMGTSTHVLWTWHNGFLSKEYNANVFSMCFWDSLTFLDPLAAFLLIVKPKTGLYLTLFIIVFDVIHNNIFYFNELYVDPIGWADWILKYWMIIGQICFGVFVVFTFRGNLKAVG